MTVSFSARLQPWHALRKWVLGVGIAVAFCGAAPAREALTSVTLDSLPPQAQRTLRLIHAGGPFPHRHDGVVFVNRERLLPSHARGYYREYTVATPSARNRGARRIVCGGAQPTAPQACFYTADHYASFSRIEQ